MKEVARLSFHQNIMRAKPAHKPSFSDVDNLWAAAR